MREHASKHYFQEVPHPRSNSEDPLIELLQLLQLSDSALPVGAASHSFGAETLADWGILNPKNLHDFLSSFLWEQGIFDACYCRAAYAALSGKQSDKNISYLAQRLSATRLARESRDGSKAMGGRLLVVGQNILPPGKGDILRSAFAGNDTHHVLVFGAIASLLQIDLDHAVLAYLQQTLAMLVSSSQRLMPVGQRQATVELWSLKPLIADVALASYGLTIYSASNAMHTLDLGSMRHPNLETRLFST